MNPKDKVLFFTLLPLTLLCYALLLGKQPAWWILLLSLVPVSLNIFLFLAAIKIKSPNPWAIPVGFIVVGNFRILEKLINHLIARYGLYSHKTFYQVAIFALYLGILLYFSKPSWRRGINKIIGKNQNT